jgi:RNA polymerase sigma-70 factor (ECF subfamily)
MSPSRVHRKGVTAALGLAEAPSALAIARPRLEELFSAHANFVWRCLRPLGVADADLEDLTQEVFLVAYRRHATWDGEHARAWLYAIARRCASAYRRRGHRRHELCVDEVPESGTEADPSTRIDIDRLDRALAAIDEDKRAVFVLFEIEEMSMRDVASTVGCPVQTAYARLYAARRELARALSEER